MHEVVRTHTHATSTRTDVTPSPPDQRRVLKPRASGSDVGERGSGAHSASTVLPMACGNHASSKELITTNPHSTASVVTLTPCHLKSKKIIALPCLCHADVGGRRREYQSEIRAATLGKVRPGFLQPPATSPRRRHVLLDD